MAYQNSNVPFEKMLMKFVSEEDPMLSMLKWLCEKLMEAEVDTKLGAEKSERVSNRQGIDPDTGLDALTHEWGRCI